MFIYKLLALFVLGAGVGSLLFLYVVEKLQDFDSIEWITLAMLVFCTKGYILRLIGVWNTFISVNYGDIIPFLCFGLGYTLILTILTNCFESKKFNAEEQDGTIQTIAKEKEFTSAILLVCFGTNLCLLATASFSYLHIINNL